MQHDASVRRYWYTAQLHTVNIYSGGVDEFSQPGNKEDDEKEQLSLSDLPLYYVGVLP